jgi:hypothetical protein
LEQLSMKSHEDSPAGLGRLWTAAGIGCLLILGQLPRHCPAQWVDRRSVEPFVCVSEFPLAEIEPLLAELGQLQADLAAALRLPAAQDRIDLYLFRNKSSYERFLAHNLPKIVYRRALYVKDQGPGRVYAYRSSQFDTDVRHECTHALLHAVLPVVPLWLDEGLAVYFEQPAEKRVFDNPQLSAVRWAIRLGGVQRLESLEKKQKTEQMERSDYKAAWAWVHFMLHGPPEAGDELIGFLANIQAGTPPGLLSQRLRSRLGNPAAQLSAHFHGWPKQKGSEGPWTGQAAGAAGRATY